MIDRDAALKTADTLIRQGRLDAAIEEYVRLVDAQPRDWNAINALGDLYVRAGDRQRAVAEFTKVADHLYAEGFLSKAAALYRKSLKLEADDDHTLWQLSDVAARQGLVADAKGYLRHLANLRRRSGDGHGEAECLIRLGRFEDADPDAMLVAARAAQAVNDRPQALALLRTAAEALQASGRTAEALDVVAEAAALDPAAAGHDPDLLLALGHRQLTCGQQSEARARLTRALAIAPDRYPEVVRIADEILVQGRIEIAYSCLEIAVDAALLENDFERAAAMLEEFLSHACYVPALRKLAAICRDAGFDDRRRTVEAELRLLGEFDQPAAAHEALSAPALDAATVDRLTLGIDEAIAAASAARAAGADRGDVESNGPPDIEAVFEQMRARARHTPEGRAAADEYDRGLAALQNDDVDAAIQHLQAAARAPLFRFNASARLGRVYATRGDLAAAVDWLERAAESPAPTPDAGVAALYDLAFTLQRMDETARALAVLLEIEADAPGYRDVRDRIAQLSKADTGSSRA